MSAQPLLSIRDLAVQYRTRRGTVDAVRGVSFDVEAGSVTALVGESGSGKTTVAQTVIGLLASNGHVSAGSIRLTERTDGPTDLVGLSERRWRHLRGRCIALIPQDPGNSLNPVATIGWSVGEALRIHGWKDRAKIRARVIDLLERVGIDDPETRARQYPHELSGGMRQRVLIAAALALRPELIIADEPTSALDVTVQRTVLDLLDELRTETGTGILFITHDLAVAADRSDAVVVMRGGQVQEAGPTAGVLAAPRSPYTRTLLADAPSLARVVERAAPDASVSATGEPLVEVSGLTQEFVRAGRSPLLAVDDVSFTVARGTTHA
ncbi:ATP-binding cassette domain-containing protein, partial [Microbacterium sp.]|uniref:ABC transporter ATP-binding protein n=2 Tax=unclassified Microbacterium TaxID=2609290 RepID=UPI001AD0170A